MYVGSKHYRIIKNLLPQTCTKVKKINKLKKDFVTPINLNLKTKFFEYYLDIFFFMVHEIFT